MCLSVMCMSPLALAEETTGTDTASKTPTRVGGAAAVMDQTDDLGYSDKLYDGTNGLPTSDANAIVATRDGFIWIGGYSGVIRYDGTTFERPLLNAAITNANTLFEDSQRRLWIGTNDNGVVAVRQDESWHFDYTDGMISSSVRAIAEDGNKHIIIGTTLGLYMVDTTMRIHRIDEPMVNNEYIERLVSTDDGMIYGLTKSGRIFNVQDAKVKTCINGADLDAGKIETIFPDPKADGMFYLGTSEGTVIHGSFNESFKNKQVIQIKGTPHNTELETGHADDTIRPVSWIDYANGKIWVIRDDLICWLDDSHGVHPLHNLPMDASICAMEEDYEGNLWFASTRQGVMKIVGNKFTDITEQNAMTTSVVNATCIHDHKLFIGTDTGLQILGDNRQIIHEKIMDYLGETRIRCLLEDKKNNLWIATYTNDMGLICYSSDGQIKAYTMSDGLPDNQIRSITESAEGDLLISSNGGLTVMRDGQIVKNYGTEDGISNPIVLTAIEDGGTFYLGTDGDGVYEIKDEAVEHLSRDDGLTSDVILRIKKDEKRNVIWLITSNSIQYIKDGEIKKVEGFPYSNNYDIYFDDGENAWILASNGIYVVKAQDMIDKKAYEFQHYDFSSGMPCMATVNAYSAQIDDGVLFIAGRTGVFTVNINDYFELENEIKLCVPYVEADDVRYYPDESGAFHLPSSADSITVYPYAITYSMQNPKLQYELTGIDKSANSIYKSEMSSIRYTNVNGGDFSFRLSVMNTSTGEEQQTQTFMIHKEKAIYEYVWFILLLTVAILSLIAGVVYIIIRRHFRKRELRQEREYRAKIEHDKKLVSEMVEAFAYTIDMKDKYTKGHSARVAKYTVKLARELGYSDDEVNDFHNIALLHDIGKIGVPPEILNKEGKLTDEEFAIIKSHSSMGFEALKGISLMPDLADGAGSHHERPDGRGYPDGLKGDEIPRVAQIIAVADTFDAMYSNRPYRKRMNFEKAVSIIKEVSGTQLTEDVVDAFLRLVEKGEFRAPDDTGGGSTEDIDNIHKKFEEE